MAYDPINGNGVGIGEARLYALRDILRARTDWLNAALGHDDVTSDLIGPPYGAILESAMDIGDTEDLWEPETEGGILRVSICEGGMKEGLDFTTEYAYTDMGQRKQTFFASLYVYFHPHAFRLYDTMQQARRREIALARISDWLRNVLNWPEMLLMSQEYNTGADYDWLQRCQITAGYKGWFPRAFGTDMVYGFHFAHQGVIQ